MIAKIVEKIDEKNTIMREELKKDREESNKLLTNALESIVSSIKIMDKDDKNMVKYIGINKKIVIVIFQKHS